jgi:hypothetical protein
MDGGVGAVADDTRIVSIMGNGLGMLS